MQTFTTRTLCFGLTSLAVGVMASSVDAGCRCGQGAGHVMAEMPPQMMMPPMQPAQPRMQSLTGPLTANPPVGTLGRTYYLPSREIPADKHPRVGMIDVHVRGATSVRVLNINPHREEDDIDGFQAAGNNSLWRFETNPLFPGIPTIYKVIIRFSEEPNARETVRIVRLIPGRIVELVY